MEQGVLIDIKSTILTITGGSAVFASFKENIELSTFLVKYSYITLEQATSVFQFLFVILSCISIFMVITINRRRFIKEGKAWFDKCPSDEEEIKD